MQRPTLLLQIVITCSITILAVSAITTATTIGSNISTDGNLTVAGLTTLSGDAILSGIATSTDTLIASSTFRAFGTTIEGTGKYYEISASTTKSGIYGLYGQYLTNPSDGNTWWHVSRFLHPSVGQYVNFNVLKSSAGDFGSGIVLQDSDGNTVIQISSWLNSGWELGGDDADTATGRSISVRDGTGGTRFEVAGATGDISTIGTITSSNAGSLGWSVVSGANTACNTTCTNACVFGQDSDAAGVIVDCNSAAADICVCAGAN